MLECSAFFCVSRWQFKLLWNGLNEVLKMTAEPGAADARHPTNAPMREAFREQLIDQSFLLRRNSVVVGIKGELIATRPTQMALFPGVRVAVFDDGDGLAAGAN